MIASKRVFYFVVFSLLQCSSLFSQDSLKSKADNIPYIRFQYNYLNPAGDLEERFGLTHSAGVALGYKLKSNFSLELEGNYHFSNNVKSEGILDDIINEAGDVTDSDGELVKLIYEHRGLSFFASIGKVFNLLSANVNSGILLQVGIGYYQHKIKIDYRDGTVFQLSDEMLKGYDRLHSGIATRQFIGYKYFGNKNLLNFYGGFEFNQAFTKNQREYNYDTRSYDKEQKLDILYGFRVGWIIPFRSRSSEEFYYY